MTGNPLYNGVDTISIVSEPAIEEDFIALRKEARNNGIELPVHLSKEVSLSMQDKDKRLLVGAALVPNKPIYRSEGDEEFYIYFSKGTIREASQIFMKKGHQNSATLEHEKRLKGITIVESWIVEDEQMDKSKLYNLSVPKGTWMVSMKVDNDEVWNDYVKEGKVKGFSIEGYFISKNNSLKKQKPRDNELAKISRTIS